MGFAKEGRLTLPTTETITSTRPDVRDSRHPPLSVATPARAAATALKGLELHLAVVTQLPWRGGRSTARRQQSRACNGGAASPCRRAGDSGGWVRPRRRAWIIEYFRIWFITCCMASSTAMSCLRASKTTRGFLVAARLSPTEAVGQPLPAPHVRHARRPNVPHRAATRLHPSARRSQ
jgi:hypothetical protein